MVCTARGMVRTAGGMVRTAGGMVSTAGGMVRTAGGMVSTAGARGDRSEGGSRDRDSSGEWGSGRRGLRRGVR